MNPSALLECLHLEALGVRVSLRILLVTLGGCRHLDSLCDPHLVLVVRHPIEGLAYEAN